MLVGNNIDKIKEREVTRGEAEMLALKLGCSYIETSAKANVNVEKAFYDLVRRLRQQREKWGLGMYSPAPRTHQPPQKKNKGVPRIWQRVRARPA
jgi:GTPase SAR1 family protein